jgi:hypothetical protein
MMVKNPSFQQYGMESIKGMSTEFGFPIMNAAQG